MKVGTVKDPPIRNVRNAWRDFDLAAACYEQGNLLLDIESAMGQSLIPSLRGKRVIDVGCGTGRWSRWALQEGAACLMQLDRSALMLRQAQQGVVSQGQAWSIQADLNELPVSPASCDCVLASLCLSYTDSLEKAISGMNQCLRPGGVLYLSDMHPDSVRLGWKRTYALPDGDCLEPPYCVHSLEAYRKSLARCELAISKWSECYIDERIRPHFEHAGHMDRYQRWSGAPLLLLVVAEKGAER